MDRSLDPRVARSRTAVLDSAAALVAEAGLAGLTVEGVVQRSGVARSTIYRQWDSVEALAGDALRTLVGGITADDRELPPPSDLGDELAVLLAPLLTGGRGRIGLLPALLAEADRSDALPDLREEVVGALLEPVRRLVERAVDDGRVRGGVDPHEAAELVLGILVVRLFLADASIDRTDLDRLATVVAGLPPREV